MHQRTYKLLQISAVVLSTTLLFACGGGGSSSNKTQKPDNTITTKTCAGVNLNDSYNCIRVDSRDSLAFVPSTISAETSIAIFLHGAPGSPSKVMNIFDAENLANSYDMIALGPKGNASDYEWDSQNIDANNTNLDINYLVKLIDEVRANYNLSSEKVYVFGYSAGGFMAYKLACKVPESITAIVSLAGQYRGDLDACPTSTPMNIHHLHSPFDKDVPYGGRAFGEIASVDDTIALWAIKNGCSDEIISTEGAGITQSSAKTTTNLYQGCTHQLGLSIMETVEHEDNYQADKLLDTFKHLLR
ncbi:alpha/beta fold hydrolase [Thalassotalea sp. M1531]|uniref:Alpha/beta fold hydrolase n=1 Tax=Thalassotalea algicola TaxID=2716224 RepID=A0A7Y0LFI3_9GAMM|nr:alpha/beta fold hydrolase [Thalassotalea algicola]NMP33521.1 alpha/beta fold hydrolase [Thalassotalea algicola]